jgi:hypothetical protein
MSFVICGGRVGFVSSSPKCGYHDGIERLDEAVGLGKRRRERRRLG